MKSDPESLLNRFIKRINEFVGREVLNPDNFVSKLLIRQKTITDFETFIQRCPKCESPTIIYSFFLTCNKCGLSLHIDDAKIYYKTHRQFDFIDLKILEKQSSEKIYKLLQTGSGWQCPKCKTVYLYRTGAALCMWTCRARVAEIKPVLFLKGKKQTKKYKPRKTYKEKRQIWLKEFEPTANELRARGLSERTIQLRWQAFWRKKMKKHRKHRNDALSKRRRNRSDELSILKGPNYFRLLKEAVRDTQIKTRTPRQP